MLCTQRNLFDVLTAILADNPSCLAVERRRVEALLLAIVDAMLPELMMTNWKLIEGANLSL